MLTMYSFLSTLSTWTRIALIHVQHNTVTALSLINQLQLFIYFNVSISIFILSHLCLLIFPHIFHASVSLAWSSVYS